MIRRPSRVVCVSSPVHSPSRSNAASKSDVRHRMLGLEELVARTANRLFPGEAIELFCASIPIDDRVRENSQTKIASCDCSSRFACCRSACSACLRSVMSLLVSRTASALPCSSDCSAHRLATTICVPSRRVWTSSPSQRPGPGQLSVISVNGAGKTVRSSS